MLNLLPERVVEEEEETKKSKDYLRWVTRMERSEKGKRTLTQNFMLIYLPCLRSCFYSVSPLLLSLAIPNSRNRKYCFVCLVFDLIALVYGLVPACSHMAVARNVSRFSKKYESANAGRFASSPRPLARLVKSDQRATDRNSRELWRSTETTSRSVPLFQPLLSTLIYLVSISQNLLLCCHYGLLSSRKDS